MKQFLDKTFGWLKESNRMKHLRAGLLIYLMVAIFCYWVMAITNYKDIVLEYYLHTPVSIICTLLAIVCTLIAMMAVEYTQSKLCKVGKFDWLDILAGILPGLILTCIILVFGIDIPGFI